MLLLHTAPLLIHSPRPASNSILLCSEQSCSHTHTYAHRFLKASLVSSPNPLDFMHLFSPLATHSPIILSFSYSLFFFSLHIFCGFPWLHCFAALHLFLHIFVAKMPWSILRQAELLLPAAASCSPAQKACPLGTQRGSLRKSAACLQEVKSPTVQCMWLHLPPSSGN